MGMIKKRDWFEEVEKYKQIRISLNRHIKAVELTKNSWGLPSCNWYLINSPFKEIKTYMDFIRWCGFEAPINLTKKEVIEKIYKMQLELDHPIDIDDFKNPKDGDIGIRVIWKHWNAVWEMQKELGLEITNIKRNAAKRTELYKTQLLKLCNYIYETEGRKCISYRDIKECEYTAFPNTISDALLNEGSTLREFLNNNSFELLKEGCGMNHTFDDGEKILSQYEFYFSSYLRKIGLKYKKDYFRDIPYSDIDSKYNGKMNCDYLITVNNSKLFIEVAGMLSKESHEKAYLQGTEIKSKSKECYRKKIEDKKNILDRNNFKYIIILPSQINDGSYKSMLDAFINLNKIARRRRRC